MDSYFVATVSPPFDSGRERLVSPENFHRTITVRALIDGRVRLFITDEELSIGDGDFVDLFPAADRPTGTEDYPSEVTFILPPCRGVYFASAPPAPGTFQLMVTGV